ncbi:MAG TPA: hypothetical protein VNW54_16590 [Granulicella sp.]|nr:hypothetical protein [Granulicella sp.]
MHEVVCKLSNEASDVRCAVCGQGFLVYWSRFTRAEQDHGRRVIQEQLRQHHADGLRSGEAHEVHPKESFRVFETHCERPGETGAGVVDETLDELVDEVDPQAV